MKTLHLSIFTGAGIVAVIFFALIVVIIPSSLADQAGLTIGIEQNEVGVGEPISFFVEISNPLQDSVFPTAIIVNEQNQTVWHDDDLPPNGYKGIEKVYYISRDSENIPIINHPGKYMLIVTFADKRATKDLTVTETIHENNMLHYYGTYKGIDKENTRVEITNQAYYLTTIHKTPSDIIAPTDTIVKFSGVAFTFPGCGPCLPMPTVQNPPDYVNVQFADKTNETLEIRNNQWSTIGPPMDSHEYFENGTKIFPNGTRGTWTPRFHMDPIVTSLSTHEHPQAGITVTHDSMKFLVSTDVSSKGKPAKNEIQIDSPLKQFKSGIKPEYVKCSQDLHLIIKAEDGSFACVTIETGKNLTKRGWATTFGTGISTNDYYTKCDTLYPQSDMGIAVLYMPTNSIGKICVRYYNLNNTPTGIGLRIFEANNLTQNASDVTAWTDDSTLEGNANKTIVYFIKTGTKAGFYGASLNCGGIPLAVGYDANSTITANDFPWVGQTFHCFAITYDSHMEGIAGIGVKYIPYP